MTLDDDRRGTAIRDGLSLKEAARRLREHGANELIQPRKAGWLRALRSIAVQPMVLLLIGGGTLYWLLGETVDAALLLACVGATVGLTLYQDRKTERALGRLRELSAPVAHVIRDGQERAIASRDVVPGDIVLLREVARVPADAVVLDSTSLRIDESLLSGESVPVDKVPGELDAPLVPVTSDEETCAYAGTLVVRGHGVAVVRQTGMGTAMGSIGSALDDTEEAQSALRKEIDRVVRRVALGGGFLCAALVAAYGAIEGDVMHGLLAGITLAMAILPEELPIVWTVFTTLGAYRIAKLGVLARRPEAIEGLGSASVLCVDKTGTITENRMRVAALWPFGGERLEVARQLPASLPEADHALLEHGVLASAADTFDPMDRALQALAGAALAGTEHLHADYVREQEYPLTRKLLAVTYLWQTPEQLVHVVASKGAPEAIADLCHLDAAATRAWLDQVAALAKDGMRVLAVARARYAAVDHPEHPYAFEMEPLGLIGFEDPVRTSVPAALERCRKAGVRVVMITGDHVTTARAIASRAGLDVASGVMTGDTFAALDMQARNEAAARISVFARAAPEHKLLLVRALQSGGEIVAMTGDGVNDAPALKAADIGIGLGSGTDVAREAAALVLMQDDFGVIADAVLLGRRVFLNLRKAASYVFAVHVPIAGMAFAPILLGLPAMLLPIHIVFLELLIDPACSIALEAEEPAPDALRRPSREGGAALIARDLLVKALAQGLALLVAVLTVYWLALRQALPDAEARALAFTSLVVGNVALLLARRDRARGGVRQLRSFYAKPAVVLSAAALGVLGLTLSAAPIARFFHFDLPPAGLLLAAVLAGLLSVRWVDQVLARFGPASARTGGGA